VVLISEEVVAVDADAGVAPPDGDVIELGLVVTPTLEDNAGQRLADELQREPTERYPGVTWRISALSDSLLVPLATGPEMFDAARSRVLGGGWNLAAQVTELPLRLARRPAVTQSSPTHTAAIVSLPVLQRRLVELARNAEDSGGLDSVELLQRVVTATGGC
jgi:hypothetical protein